MKKTIKNLWVIMILFMLFTTTLFTSCNKLETIDQTCDVSFNVNSVSQNGNFKSTNDTIICSQLKADYVTYKVDGGDFKIIPVFYVGDIPWTNSIKLTSGSHILNEFVVYSDNNTPNDISDDIVLSATPHIGSTFAGFVTTPLDQTFTITTDQKNEILIDVVCFEQKNYENFGFVYWKLNNVIVRELYFFGDFCIKDASQYTGSQYSQQTNWVTTGYIDAPAIAKVEVWRNGVLQNTYNNTYQGEKFSVKYGDYTQQTDNFELKLFILVRQGIQFNYVYFKSFTFQDISNISEGTDGIVDFVLGNCYDPSNPPNVLLAPWMNLPPTLTYKMVSGTFGNSTLGGYVDAILTNIGTGYEFTNGTYASWCSDHTVGISYIPYNMNSYSSLYPNLLPPFAQGNGKWSKLNWLFNHLDWYPTITPAIIQSVIWSYDNSPLTPTGLAAQIKNDCDTYGVNYQVPPGGWASIIFIPVGTPPNATTAAIQTMFIKIDP